MTATAPLVESPRRRRTRRLIYAAMLSIAAVAFVAAFYVYDPEEKLVRPQAIRAVAPIEDAQEVRQTSILAELSPGFDGELTFDSTPIPLDQTDKILTGGNRISFTPGEGKEFEKFPPGKHCATIRYWPAAEGMESSSNYRWCFELH